VQRVAIVGGSGSGKSTLAATVAEQLDGDHIELDELFHRPNWEPTPTPEFRAKVAEAINTECWAAAGNYSVVMDLVHRSADTIVWLDLPRWLVTGRVIRRSLGRVITREQLWNGNRETWRNLVSRRPEDNIIVWAWTHHGAHNERFEEFASGKFWAHADVHRLRSRKDVKAFLASVSR
jgi:adenylate kinase family enzyme